MKTLESAGHRPVAFPIRFISTPLVFIAFLSLLSGTAKGQCTLSVTDPDPVCAPGTVDLTDPAITAGSSAGMIFTYWKDSNCLTPVTDPLSVDESGVYFIKAITPNGCWSVKPVKISIIGKYDLEMVCEDVFIDACRDSIPPDDRRNVYCCSPCPGDIAITTIGDTVLNEDCCSRLIVRSYRATDECGQYIEGSQIIHVADISPPKLVCPPDITIECSDSSDPVKTGFATASDNCDPYLTFTFTDSIVSGACSGELTIHRTWTAVDVSGNVSTGIQIISVVDHQCPVLIVPPDITISKDAYGNYDADPSITGVAISTDNCSIGLITTYSDVINPGGYDGEVVITRTWTAADACGNTNTGTQVITVIPATGIDSTTASPSFRVYPNPNDGTFNFEYHSAKSGPIRLSVVDMTGRIVWNRNFPNGNKIKEGIRLPDDVKGAFLLQIISTSDIHHQLIVVQ